MRMGLRGMGKRHNLKRRRENGQGYWRAGNASLGRPCTVIMPRIGILNTDIEKKKTLKSKKDTEI